MARESARSKADRYLLEGRVIVREAGRYWFAAHVRGEGAVYRTVWSYGTWSCDCPALRPTCSHVVACKRICAVDLPRGTR